MTLASLLAAIMIIASPDRVDEQALAQSVLSATNGNPEWAALVLAVAKHETHLSDRIRRGECKPWECDHGRAWGLLQEHRNKHNEGLWGSPDVNDQVLSGYRMLRRSYWTCSRYYPKNPPADVWVRFTLNAYAGKRCDAEWRGLEERVASFKAIRVRL